jgi:hypothetical protein
MLGRLQEVLQLKVVLPVCAAGQALSYIFSAHTGRSCYSDVRQEVLIQYILTLFVSKQDSGHPVEKPLFILFL